MDRILVPHLKFIETLVCGKLPPLLISKQLKEANLPIPEPNIIAKIAENVKSTNLDYFANFSSPPETTWLKDLGVEKMYGHIFNVRFPAGTVGIKGAFNIINDPPMYRLITSLALAKINDSDIDLIVNGKFNTDYSFEDVTEFLYYFFNVKDWSIIEKKDFAVQVTNEDLRKYYKMALTGDKDFLLWKLGASPDLSFDNMLKDMAVDSYYMFKDKARFDSDAAQKWGALAVKITEKLEKVEKESVNRKDLFNDIIFNLDPSSSSDGKKVRTKTTIKHLSEVINRS